MKRVMPWLLTLVLLAGAWLLNSIALPEGSSEESFFTRATVGEAATARNLELTVTDVRAARGIADPRGWSAQGTWLVVELDAQALTTQYAASLGFAELTIADRVFRATERGETFFRGRLVPGVPRSGAIAFELPGDALQGTATLRLGVPSDARYDGLVELAFDAEDIPVEDAITLPTTDWTRS
ncbi:hypothetical protein Q9R19_11085 [Microbacterium sp. ARD32]|uniref:hypothetical protein n=1 Tax=Microbacterium sp. ARD32 TaxID=2962577 RepID=UPI002880D206|nr:hypothetical protein [Microbacterium sp. ARD32]MDT0158169.1 hypothetical protein [Microbacterium sp. ARD32]